MSKASAGGSGGGAGRGSRAPVGAFAEVPYGIDKASGGKRADSIGQALADTWVNSLTEEENKAIRVYKGEAYSIINAALREGEELTGFKGRALTNLTEALARASLPQGVIGWRAADLPDFRAAISDGSPLTMVGHTFHDKAFTSTSLNPAVAAGLAEYTHKDILFKIKVPRGTQAQYIDHPRTQGIHKDENELLLNRGYTFKVTKYLGTSKHKYDEGKTHIYELEVTGREA